MFITIDHLASRYHLLPSDIINRASTFDLYIMDLSIRWSNYKYEQSNQPKQPPVAKLTQDQMLDLVAAARKLK